MESALLRIRIKSLVIAVVACLACSVQTSAHAIDSGGMPTPSSGAGPAVTGITLDAADRGPLTVGNSWWRENDASNSIVKYVEAGSRLTLHYTATDASGNPVAGVQVMLDEDLIYSNHRGTFSGSRVEVTDFDGRVEFTLMNTNSGTDVESARSDLTIWTDPTTGMVERDFTPYISSPGSGDCYVSTPGSCARDRVWTHILPSSAPSVSPTPTPTQTPTPSALPAPASAPSILGVVAGNTRATLAIAPPLQINDTALTGYEYSSNDGVTWSPFATVDGPFVIAGLVNGSTYQVKVRAVNSAGVGDASDTTMVYPTKLRPAVPLIDSIRRGDGQATLTILTPIGATAQSVSGYQYNVNGGALWKPVALTDGSFTVTGLTNGTNYAFRVRAVNVNGVSGTSGKVAVTPMTTASASTIQSIRSLNGGLVVTFGGAIDNGGSVARNYQYSLDGGSTWDDCAPTLKLGPTMTIRGLTNGTTYQVAIRMVNAVGPGAASNVVSATPMTTPSAPVIGSAIVGKTSAVVSFAGVANRGAEITGYTYSLDNKTWTSFTPVGGQFTVAGLTAYKSYKVYVRASNVMGNGAVGSKSFKTLK